MKELADTYRILAAEVVMFAAALLELLALKVGGPAYGPRYCEDQVRKADLAHAMLADDTNYK